MKFDRSTFIQKYLSETRDNLERINRLLLELEKNPADLPILQDLMRSLHTIKGSSRMLNISSMGDVAHHFEEAVEHVTKREGGLVSSVIDIFLETSDRMVKLLDDVALEQSSPTEDILENLQHIIDGTPKTVATPEPVSPQKGKPVRQAVHIDKTVFIQKFLTEAMGYHKTLADFAKVTKPGAELLDHTIRAAHTLKGNARMLKFENCGNLAQRLEMMLRALKGRKISWKAEVKRAFDYACRSIGEMLEEIKKSGDDRTKNAPLIDLLDQIAGGRKIDASALSAAFENREIAVKPSSVTATGDAVSGDRLGERLIHAGLITREQLNHVNQTTDAKTPLGERLVGLGLVTKDNVHKLLQEQKATRELLGQVRVTKTNMEHVDHVTESRREVLADQSIRISLDKLDVLIKLAGELTPHQIKNNEHTRSLSQIYIGLHRAFKDLRLKTPAESLSEDARDRLEEMDRLFGRLSSLIKDRREATAALELVHNDIQQSTLGMRMIPLRAIFDAFPRAVRDLAKTLQKQVELVIEGAETEMDRKMVEKLNEPLIHLIRNAVDHGLETPQERLNAGKPESGRMRISAMLEGNSIVIDVEDDGRGLDLERIKARALEKKIVQDAEELKRYSEHELVNLIFHPGFSTLEFITDISGRGFGMDVVKQSVEALKGYISIRTAKNVGSLFTIHLPVTLTALRALIVRAGHNQYAFPLPTVEETVKITRADIIQVIDRQAIRQRNQLIGLYHLLDVMGQPMDDTTRQREEYFAVIARASGERKAFIVDDILDERDIIVKPLPSYFHSVRQVSSATVTADNEIVLVLHVPELIGQTRQVMVSGQPVAPKKTVSRILVVDDSLNTREIEKTILQAYGYDVETATDGLDAFEKIKMNSYDLVVTDLEMPIMDGFTLTSKIRATDTVRNLPVVMVTSRESADDKRRGLEVGANAYIVKGSFDQTNLIDTVESLIGL